ncbi:MAG: DUF333 domain-containing protein [Patescibacteria group bacterium]|nr:DUF333 domain-containing protein [Patescibacteria group bacterium]MDD4610544.1 DUF333 domain-containing protein [Patescibacteria group bacterium]
MKKTSSNANVILTVFVIALTVIVIILAIMIFYFQNGKCYTQRRGANNAVEFTPAAGLANPASVNCEERGGQLEIKKDATGGEYGMCGFKDGSECEEWKFFRNECKEGESLKK